MIRRFVALTLLLALWAAPAFGQGCAMCYSSAKGASVKSQKALSRAVIVLLLPTVTMMGGLVGLGFHYGRKRDRENNEIRVDSDLQS